jgi:hypothetical protein
VDRGGAAAGNPGWIRGEARLPDHGILIRK